MSLISNIFNSYKKSLDASLKRYQDAYKENAQHAKEFYEACLNRLILDFNTSFTNTQYTNRIIEKIDRFFQTRELPFVAIDGTCSNDPFNDFMVFFAAAYGVKGKLNFESNPPKIKYEKWTMDHDVSIVAYVPVPYAEAGDIIGNTKEFSFTVDDTQKINLSSIHNRLMQLGEIYLAYELAKSSTIEFPKLILLDMSLSGTLMSTDVGLKHINLFGSTIGSTAVTREHALVTYAHPVNSKLGLPSPKQYRRWAFLVGHMTEINTSEIQLSDLIQLSHVNERNWRKSLVEKNASCLFDLRPDGSIHAKVTFNDLWEDSKNLFDSFCRRLFHRRDPESLIFPVKDDEGNRRLRWMSPNDISFLVAIGLRALIELCWEKKILLLGIAKDSSSRYFCKHYLGVMRKIGKYPEVTVGTLPWTDRMLLESIAFLENNLNCPWSTIEFDSVFMTLHVGIDGGEEKVLGQRGSVVNTERLFSRSLAQFFCQRRKKSPLMGHVIFIDRLLHPYFDEAYVNGPEILLPVKKTKIYPYFIKDNSVPNDGQAISMWILSKLTRNLFPEVIGYPDPLHKADWGAKSVKKRVDKLIKSSEIAFRSNPIFKTLRTIRDAAGR